MPNTPNTTPNTRLIALPEVSAITTLGKTSLYQLVASGDLRPIKLGRKTVFAECEVFDWVNRRLASRTKNPINSAGVTTAPAQSKDTQTKPHNVVHSASPSDRTSHE